LRLYTVENQYDNITSVPEWFSNGLCGLSTGTGFTIRAGNTDDEEIIFAAERPVVLTGIGDFVNRDDLADRSLFLHLPPILKTGRRTEKAFWADFHRDYPEILGGLLDAVVAGMRMLPDVHLKELSRMADAELWGEAVARGLGWAPGTFSIALGSNRAAASESALEESPVAVTLVELIGERGGFLGKVQDLLHALSAMTRFNKNRTDWPKTPRALSCKLRALAPQLRSIGIDVSFGRSNRDRIVTIAPGDGDDKAARDARNARLDAQYKASAREFARKYQTNPAAQPS
jgi:hypothetical protein